MNDPEFVELQELVESKGGKLLKPLTFTTGEEYSEVEVVSKGMAGTDRLLGTLASSGLLVNHPGGPRIKQSLEATIQTHRLPLYDAGGYTDKDGMWRTRLVDLRVDNRPFLQPKKVHVHTAWQSRFK